MCKAMSSPIPASALMGCLWGNVCCHLEFIGGDRPLFSGTWSHAAVAGIHVRLSPKEYDILQQMVIHAGKVLTHRPLIHEVWRGADTIDVQALRVFIRQLRQKIEANPEQPGTSSRSPVSAIACSLRNEQAIAPNA